MPDLRTSAVAADSQEHRRQREFRQQARKLIIAYIGLKDRDYGAPFYDKIVFLLFPTIIYSHRCLVNLPFLGRFKYFSKKKLGVRFEIPALEKASAMASRVCRITTFLHRLKNQLIIQHK
jgi:hypothetical protein